MSRWRKKKILYSPAVVVMAFLVLAIAGCSAAQKAVSDLATPPAAPAERPQMMELAGMESKVQYSEDASSSSGAGGEAGFTGVKPESDAGRRYIILNAELTLVIDDIEKAAREIQSAVNQLGGYMASLEFYDLTQERRAGRMAIRVPADKYGHMLEILDGLGETKNKREYTDDVTLHYIDLEARITNLQAQEKRMRDLLDRAETIEEILQIEKELGRIRGDLEAMSAEFNHLKERVHYSSINIRLEEKDPRTHAVVDGFGTFGERVGNLLALNTNRFLKGMSNFMVISIGSLPILLPLLVIIFLLWKIAAAMGQRKRKIQEQKNGNPPDIQLPGGPAVK